MITGNGLNVLITIPCHNFQNDWLSYSCWYSIHHYLPDANILILFPKPQNPSDHFRWTIKVGVKRFIKKIEPLLVVPNETILVRDLDSNILSLDEIVCCPVKENRLTPFVTVGDTCGKYRKEVWQTKPPFEMAHKMKTTDCSVNETAVLNLWSKMQTSYNLLV